MRTEQYVGRVSGLAVSLGIGVAIVTGGLGEASANPNDSSASSASPSNPASSSNSSASTHAASGPKSRRSSAASRRRAERDVDDRPSAPVRAQAVTAMLVGSRRPQIQPLDRAAVTGIETNAPPTATAAVADPDPLSGATQVAVTAADPDGDALAYSATRPTFGRVVGDGGGNFVYTPTPFARAAARVLPSIRSDRFSVTVTDSHGATASVRVTTPVVPVNAAPKARSATVNAPATSSGAVTGRANATDPNRDKLTYLAATTATGKGSVTVNANGTFTYTPTASARHAAASANATAADRVDTFAVTVTDVYGAVTRIPVTVAIGPSNTAPTGTAAVGVPDPASGTVTGTVRGTDADGDALSFGGSTTTRKGTVTVTAGGDFTYTPSEVARRNASSVYATPALASDTFAVTIADGHGGVTTVDIGVMITPGSAAPVAVPQSTFCGCTLMPGNSIFHADIRDLRALAQSEAWIDLLGGNRGATLRANWGGAEWMGSTAGIPVNVVDGARPKERVIFNRGYSTSGPGIDDRPYAIPDRPLVEGMPSYPAWDRHLLVFQQGTCVSQELLNVANGVELPGAGVLDILGNAVYRSLWGSSWIAEAGAQYDMNSANYPSVGHANAARLPYLATMLRPDEITRGYVDHMLGIVIAKEFGAGYVWPALAGDGSAADGVPMGMVFRLRDDVDLGAYSASTQAVLRALQVHGAVIYDSGPSGDGIKLSAMSNGWEGTDYVEMQRELNTVPLQWFEAVDAAALAADPAASWQIR